MTPLDIMCLVFSGVTIAIPLSIFIMYFTAGNYRLIYIDGSDVRHEEELPWKWLSIIRLKCLIKQTTLNIVQCWVEDIRDEYYDQELDEGKVVWKINP